MRTSREREVIDDVVRTLRAVIDLFFADGRNDGSTQCAHGNQNGSESVLPRSVPFVVLSLL